MYLGHGRVHRIPLLYEVPVYISKLFRKKVTFRVRHREWSSSNPFIRTALPFFRGKLEPLEPHSRFFGEN